MSRQTHAIIHTSAIQENFARLSALSTVGQTMAVIKADAYGHGAATVAHALKSLSERFAVAITEEALVLRDAGIDNPVVVLEGPHDEADCHLAFNNNCILVCHSKAQLEWVRACKNKPVVWLKVDSGMHRLGFNPEDVVAIAKGFDDVLTPESVLVTHLACADDTHNAFSQEQIARFSTVVEQLNMPVSVANSPATIGWPASHGDWNRVGVAVYGGESMSLESGNSLPLKPAMTLVSSVLAVRTIKAGEGVGYGQVWRAEKPSVIATVGIGYADGYPRHCPNGTPVLVNGVECPLVGRVSMDMITIDCSHVPNVQIGDSVELWGKHISIDRIAQCAGTISYELMTRVSPRVPRIADV